MSELKSLELIQKDELLAKVNNLQTEGWRIVQICAVTRTPEIDLTYTFNKGEEEHHLRFTIQSGEEISSVSGIYLSSLLYENELHDLFGIPVRNMKIDYNGNLYRTKVKTPFNPGITPESESVQGKEE